MNFMKENNIKCKMYYKVLREQYLDFIVLIFKPIIFHNLRLIFFVMTLMIFPFYMFIMHKVYLMKYPKKLNFINFVFICSKL